MSTSLTKNQKKMSDDPLTMGMKIEKIVYERSTLHCLCSEILATLKVNRARGYITSTNEEEFQRLVDSFTRRLKEIKE